MTKDEYEDFALRYKGCGACFPMYHTLSRFEKMWFSAIQKDVAKLEKENAEFHCQMNRNKFCYSCINATDKCFKNEIGCPCEKYKSYKDENAELKGIKDIATIIRANNDTVITLMQLNNMLVSKNQQLTKAKELLAKWVELFKPKSGNIPPTPVQVETEQFLNEARAMEGQND